MSSQTFRMLIVEDDEKTLDLYRSSNQIYQEQKSRSIDLIECKTLEEATEKIDASFDAAIIDLKLGNQDLAGNDVIKKIQESFFRIPVAIFTGTPDAADQDSSFVKIYKKGEHEYAEILDFLWEIYQTGLTRVMGGRGLIEASLNKVFVSLMLQIEKWKIYGKEDSDRTEKALLRHTLNHLLFLLDENDDACFPEEFYLSNTFNNQLRTGCLLKRKSDQAHFLAMSPACDLVIRKDGKPKTDKVLLSEIIALTTLFPSYPNLSRPDKNELEKAFKNNKAEFYHWLPKTDAVLGGFLNFRNLLSLPISDFEKNFEILTQVSPSFLKDIISRFSRYYARQGQPDIDYSDFLSSWQDAAGQ